MDRQEQMKQALTFPACFSRIQQCAPASRAQARGAHKLWAVNYPYADYEENLTIYAVLSRVRRKLLGNWHQKRSLMQPV